MNYELFQQGPAVYIPIILLSLVITVVAYGAFPFIFSKARNKSITKKKYRRLRYGINAAVMFLFIVINGEASSGGPYLLWTWIFSNWGTRILDRKGLISDGSYTPKTHTYVQTEEPAPIVTPPTPVAPTAIDIDNSSDPLKAIMEAQAKETIRVMEANRTAQPNNENDPEFGLVPEKPIFTLATEIIDGQRAYLGKLRTLNGDKITWKRLGSTSVEGINGMIDIYETYLPSGVPYKTLYINMYGARTSKTAPAGFCFPEQRKVVTPPAPVSARPKQAQVAPKKRSKAPIIILSVICALLIAANIAQYFLYKEAVKDTEQQLVTANNTIEANNRKISDLEDDSDHYNEIIRYAKYEDFGYAASNFRASTGVIVVDKDNDNTKFTLTANWSNGGTVEVDYSSSAAWVDFDKNEWTTSTTMTVIPNYEGVCVVTFSNNVDSKTFSVLIIVTD